MTRTLLVCLGLLLGWGLLSPDAEAKRPVFPKPGYILRVELRGTSMERRVPKGTGVPEPLREQDDKTLSTVEVEIVPGQRFFARLEHADEIQVLSGWAAVPGDSDRELQVDLSFGFVRPKVVNGTQSRRSSSAVVLKLEKPVSVGMGESIGVRQEADGPVQHACRSALRLTLLRGVPDVMFGADFSPRSPPPSEPGPR